MKEFCTFLRHLVRAATVALFSTLSLLEGFAQQPGSFPEPKELARITGEAEPFFEVWDEENAYGVLEVAMDGTVLLFSQQGDPGGNRRGRKIFLKRSEDGGATWTENKIIGDPIHLDTEKLGIGPYNGKGWGNDKHHAIATLGTSIVDQVTGEIMIFMTALHPAASMYKSKDHGKTWKLEPIEFKKDSRGFLPIPNAACDPGITLKHGPHKGRLLVPSRVMPNYRKQEEGKGYTNAVYSDDHGKTWHQSEPFPLDGTGESGLVELRDGTIYLNSRTHMRKGNRWVAFSDDSGKTWRDLHQDDELFDGPPDMYGCKAGLLRLDRDDADILLFSSPSPNLPGRKNIRVWVSFDGGKTWPYNRLIKRGPGNYTWMTQGRKGTPSEGFLYLLSGKDWMARFNLSWLLTSTSSAIVLGARSRYRFADQDLFLSAENAEAFATSKPRLNTDPLGYRAVNDKELARVVTRRLVLPSNKMKLSYHVPEGGKLQVWVLDESDSRVRDTHAITGSHQTDKLVDNWQDGPLDEWVGKVVQLEIRLEGGAQVFGFGFDDLPTSDNSTASIDPNDDRFVLPPRHDYFMVQKPAFVKSGDNATSFPVADDRLKGIESGFRLGDVKRKGHVLSHKISLPHKDMKLSCDVSSGSLAVSLFDEQGKLINTSKPITGGFKPDAAVQWPDGFKLDDHVSRPVSLRIDLTGAAKLYALRFERVFWE